MQAGARSAWGSPINEAKVQCFQQHTSVKEPLYLYSVVHRKLDFGIQPNFNPTKILGSDKKNLASDQFWPSEQPRVSGVCL